MSLCSTIIVVHKKDETKLYVQLSQLFSNFNYPFNIKVQKIMGYAVTEIFIHTKTKIWPLNTYCIFDVWGTFLTSVTLELSAFLS